jgi:hypothetical protein
VLALSHICSELHKIANEKSRHFFPFNDKLLLKNGIYIIFEKGEDGHGKDRIVRIGTHTGSNQLRSRLRQHFIQENKDRSIFRKNIGRCILNNANDLYLSLWELDCTTSDAKKKYGPLINREYQAVIEKKVSEYIQGQFSFCVMDVESKEDRLYLESRLISTVSGCKECSSSETWLGLSSPVEKIKRSGMWQVNELYKEPLTSSDFTKLGV